MQMSCHVRGARGGLVHHEFLAEGPGDPRPAIAEAVVSACEGARTVVAYNASFERGRLVHLAENVPSLRTALLDVADRLVDLLPIVRDHVYHPDFGGSFSLKSVAPALVSGLGYEDLEIGEGSAASNGAGGAAPPVRFHPAGGPGDAPPATHGLLRTGHARDGEGLRAAPGSRSRPCEGYEVADPVFAAHVRPPPMMSGKGVTT